MYGELDLRHRQPASQRRRWWWSFDFMLGRTRAWHREAANVYEQTANCWLVVSNTRARDGQAVEALRAAQEGQEALDKAEYHAFRGMRQER